MRKTKSTRQPSTAVAVLEPAAGAIVNFDEAAHKARSFRVHARSESTRKKYAYWWHDFQDWCGAADRDPLPRVLDTGASAEVRAAQLYILDNVAGYLGHLADGRGSGKPMAVTTVMQAFSGLQLAIRMAAESGQEGEPRVPSVDFNSPRLKETLKGIRNRIAKERTIRKVTPLSNKDIQEILAGLRNTVPREARDAAMLSLGWAAARRRSEVVGLDWKQVGTIPDDHRVGFADLDDKGITITLLTGKTHQDHAETYVIPKVAMPTACEKLEEWVAIGGIQPGTPLFRNIKGIQFDERGQKKCKQSGYKGVTWHAPTQKWQARVWLKDGAGKGYDKSVGLFEKPEQAYAAYRAEKGEQVVATAGAGMVLPGRLTADALAQAIKRRIAKVLKGRVGKKLKASEAAAMAMNYSGHSMRSGLITHLAEKGVGTEIIMTQSGHRDPKQVVGYVRIAEKWKKNALNGHGF